MRVRHEAWVALLIPAWAGLSANAWAQTCNNNNICLPVTQNGQYGTAIEGIATNTNGAGVVGENSNSATYNGVGVEGISNSYGAAIWGSSLRGNGLYAESGGTGAAIYGYTISLTSTTALGVEGKSNAGTGVGGYSTSGYGVQAQSASGVALLAQTGGNNDAVQGLTSADCCSGGYFANTGAGNGVYVTGTNRGLAVHGVNVGGWAGYFEGNVYATGTYQSSDARLKRNVKDGQHGLSDLLKLRPVTFTWKNDKDDKTQLGLIAQDVAKVVPEVVVPDHSGMLSINYVALVPVMLKAIQEQQKLIQQQEVRIADLERGHPPIASSILPGGGAAGAVLLGLVPLGVIVSRRKKKQPPA